ncbi:MAG: M48 family metallopeptidase [Prevotellaceae bacterium]|jgi:predicted metal-dependent hydrolase|nr:M48 family metallopeptidase [Prevotellaceae bacterium]
MTNSANADACANVVEYRKSRKAKRLSICVKNQGNVVVSIPEGVSPETAEKFVQSKKEWIEKAIRRLQTREPKHSQTVYTPNSEFCTKFRAMKFLPDNRKNFRLHILDKHFDIYYPRDVDFENETVQSVIRQLVEHVWKVEANEYLPQRMRSIAAQCGLSYKSLHIKNTRSFWGQCRRDNVIILSLHLMHLPDHLIDYVIMHELCHTIHKNHQNEFWALLDSLTGGKAKLLAKEMGNYSTRIY